MPVFTNILITGASSGIGEALARYYAANGAKNMFLCGRNAKRLTAVAEACRAQGAKVQTKILDVADREKTKDWITACNKSAPLNLVIANAGVSTGEETAENVFRTFDTNVMGVVNTVIPTIELYRQRPKEELRAIALTSSIAGYHGLMTCPSYSAGKACVKAWGEALRLALKREGIRVSVICPGFVRSRITDKNTCPMPFFMEAPQAAEIIAHGIRHNIGLIAFPWPMRFAAWLGSILPSRISELIYSFLPYKV